MIDDLSRELAAVGIRGRLRARILAEATEHLQDGDAAAFGDPKLLAREFADVAGAAEARRSAWTSFASLALVGCVYAVAFVQLGHRNGDVVGLQLAAAIGMIVLPQVSLVSGALAPFARSPRIAVRRAAVGLAAGAGSLACAWGLGWRVPWALGLAAAAVCIAAVATARASRIRTAAGPSEWTLSWSAGFAVAALAAVAVGIAGASGGDLGEGVRNAIGESVACLAGFAALGKTVGLRR